MKLWTGPYVVCYNILVCVCVRNRRTKPASPECLSPNPTAIHICRTEVLSTVEYYYEMWCFVDEQKVTFVKMYLV